MALTRTQKKWAIGGGFGAAALAVGYVLFHSRSAHASSRQLPHAQHHAYHKRRKHPHARADGGDGSDGGGENERGEYGSRKHHHRGHDRG